MTAPRTRSRLLSDAEYFAVQLARRLDGLRDSEPIPHVQTNLRVAGVLVWRVRGYLRHQSDLDARRRRLAARAAR